MQDVWPGIELRRWTHDRPRPPDEHTSMGACFLAALVAVLATMLSSASVSAETTAGSETRVRAYASSIEQFVGTADQITTGQRLGNNAAGPEIVVVTCVAAKTGAKVCSFAA